MKKEKKQGVLPLLFSHPKCRVREEKAKLLQMEYICYEKTAQTHLGCIATWKSEFVKIRINAQNLIRSKQRKGDCWRLH